MNWLKVITGVLVLWSGTAWGATLTWTASSASDLAGYRVYHCSQQPCTRTSGTAYLLVVLGKVTSFNIGTPAVTQYYFVTAYDFINNESGASNLATFTPAGTLPPPPSLGTVSLTVVGTPATGPWGVTTTTTSTQDVMAYVCLDGVVQSVDNYTPYDLVSKLYGKGTHTVLFVYYLQNTTTEIGRASVTVHEGSPAPSNTLGTVSLTVVGTPATGPWGVTTTTTSTKDVMAYVRLDGVLQSVDNYAPYDLVSKLYYTGSHVVEFVYYLQGTTSEIGRASITVKEGS
jgi:hypothetical protein